MSESRPLRLLQLTDLHLLGDPNACLRDHNPLRSLHRVMAATHATSDQWDALLLTGDLVNDDPAGYAHVHACFSKANAPVYCIPGNHDVPEAMAQQLNSAPFQTGGSAILGAWHIILLDSHLAGEAAGKLSDQELERLDQQLQAHTEQHALVCLHHHPIDSGSQWLDTVGLRNAAALFAVLDRHPQVRAVLWGHVHQASDTDRRGVRLLGTPSTGVQFKPVSADFALDTRPAGYRWLELSADGSVRTRIEWVHHEGNDVTG